MYLEQAVLPQVHDRFGDLLIDPLERLPSQGLGEVGRRTKRRRAGKPGPALAFRPGALGVRPVWAASVQSRPPKTGRDAFLAPCARCSMAHPQRIDRHRRFLFAMQPRPQKTHRRADRRPRHNIREVVAIRADAQDTGQGGQRDAHRPHERRQPSRAQRRHGSGGRHQRKGQRRVTGKDCCPPRLAPAAFRFPASHAQRAAAAPPRT